jgi:hypothetical protein
MPLMRRSSRRQKIWALNPQMKGSAAFAGLKFPAEWQLSDFLELDVTTKLQAAGRTIAAPRRESNRATQLVRSDTSKTSKDTDCKSGETESLQGLSAEWRPLTRMPRVQMHGFCQMVLSTEAVAPSGE